jgi:hypothetical protein
MATYRARSAFLASSFARAAIQRSSWGWVLIAIVAIIAVDSLLAAGAWFIVGYLIGK